MLGLNSYIDIVKQGFVWFVTKIDLVKSDIAIGLAIGSGSHVIGSIILSKNNVYQGAYSSVALITSALLTAFIIPVLVPLLLPFFS